MEAVAARRPYVALVGPWILMFFLVLIVTIAKGKPLALDALLVPLAVGCCIFIFLFSKKLILTDSFLSYRSLFFKYSIDICDVLSVKTQIGVPGKPLLMAMIITPKPETGKKPLIINMRYFSSEDMEKVMNFFDPNLKKENWDTHFPKLRKKVDKIFGKKGKN